MSAPDDIDAAIDRLDEALRAVGLPGLELPVDVAPIAELSDVVAPYVLPAELCRFWERVEPDRVAVVTFPMLHGPAHALQLLRVFRESEPRLPLGPPSMLLPLDYASQCYGIIELGSEWCDGGTILEWDLGAVTIVSHSIADRINLLAELIFAGHFDHSDDHASLDHRVEQERRTARLDASMPHPVYGNLRSIPTELQYWPAHWLSASGIDLRDREPLGASHSIAELVAAAAQGTNSGRIHAEVTSLVATTAGARVVVDDGTGSLDVWCPAGTSPWGPVHRERFEFQLTIDGPVRAPPDLDTPHKEVTRHALAGDLGSAQDAAIEIVRRLESHPAAAVASDIRPLD